MKTEKKEYDRIHITYKATTILDTVGFMLAATAVLEKKGTPIYGSTSSTFEKGDLVAKSALEKIPNIYQYNGATVTIGEGRYNKVKTTGIVITKPNGATTVKNIFLKDVSHFEKRLGNEDSYIISYNNI